jgi:small subunit ribosomal protein S10
MYNFQIKAYEVNLLNKFIPILKVTLTNFLKNDISISILRVPTRIKRFTLLKSPHVNKTAREQFEIRIYNCLLKVDTTSTIMQDIGQTIQNIIPPGIAIKYIHKSTL